jgi:hypothetical protein
MILKRSTLKNIIREEQDKLDNELSTVDSDAVPEIEIPEELQKVPEFMALSSDKQIKLTFILSLGVKKFEEYQVSSLTEKELSRLLIANDYDIKEYQWVIDNKHSFVKWYVDIVFLVHVQRFVKMSKKGMLEG